MANRVASPNLFASTSPNWSLALLDQNANNATGAINDSSLGSVNGPLTDTGAVNAYSVTCTYGAPSAYNNGMTVFFKPTTTNTGASTLTVSPLSSLPITACDGTALAGGELAAGVAIGVVCDGTAFRIFSFQGPSQITAVRLRSFSSVGNPNGEVTQRNCRTAVNVSAGTNFIEDRWVLGCGGTLTAQGQGFQSGLGATAGVSIPGTSYAITTAFLRITSTTTKASLAAGDSIYLQQSIEGPMFRELMNDVTSLSILCRSTVANLKFGIALRDPTGSRSLTKLCTLGAANTITAFQLPNLPIWPSAGTFTAQVGSVGYLLSICVASGSTMTSPANDTWQSGNFFAATGQDNLAATASGVFEVFVVQHCPGSNTDLMDKPFSQNYDECLRYYSQTYAYGTKAGTATFNGSNASFYCAQAGFANGYGVYPKRMAKTPGTTIYNPNTGTQSSAYDPGAGANVTLSGLAYGNDLAFMQLSASGLAVGHQLIVHYVGDTGW